MNNYHDNVLSQTKTEIGLGICLSLATAGLIWSQTEQSQVHTWLLMSTTIYALRYGLVDYVSKLLSANRDNSSNKMFLLAGIGLSGLAWASLIINTPFMTGDSPFNLFALAAAGVLSFIVFALYLGKLDLVMTFALTALMVPVITLYDQIQQNVIGITFLSLWIISLFIACIRITRKLNNIPARKPTETLNEAALKKHNLKLTQQLAAAEGKVEELQGALKLTNLDLETYQNKADALSITLNQINPFDLESGLLTEHKHKNILQREWARMGRLNLPITLVYLSLDDYDKYEEANDKNTCAMTLKRVVKIIKSTCKRPGDVFAKLKNQQIALLLPETELEDSINLANTICKQIQDLSIKHVKNASNDRLTASLGIASVIPNELLTEGEFLKRADSALYEAKFQGGNRVVHYVSHPDLQLLHWDEAKDGAFNTEKLTKKISNMGFETENKTYLPGRDIKDRRTHAEFLIAVLTGNLLVTIDGDATKLRPGDSLMIPKSLTFLCQVQGSDPVICYEGNR